MVGVNEILLYLLACVVVSVLILCDAADAEDNDEREGD